MDNQVFKNISQIIERDSKVSTYKFALLRGTIDIVQENSPYLIEEGDRIKIPFGLLVEKWLVYYYPLLEAETLIPQLHKGRKLAFEYKFRELIEFYRNNNGFSAFYRDYSKEQLPQEILPVLVDLVKSIKRTIAEMPMRYIGNSVYQSHYSVYKKEGNSRPLPSNRLSRIDVIECCGWFSIPHNYFEAFRLIGSFIGGQDSILFKWADFSKRINSGLDMGLILKHVLKSPITERDSNESKKLYERILNKRGEIQCVWTGDRINSYDVDHIIPFSIWRNNDLWNLLPSRKDTNSNKSNKIPSPETIEKCRDRIMAYWSLIEGARKVRFIGEIKVSLLGSTPTDKWKKTGILQLQKKCEFLIENRGFEVWNI